MRNRKDIFIALVDRMLLEHPATTIAAATGDDRSNVSAYLNINSTKHPSKAFLIRFCEAFKIDYKAVFEGPDPKDEKIAWLEEKAELLNRIGQLQNQVIELKNQIQQLKK